MFFVLQDCSGRAADSLVGSSTAGFSFATRQKKKRKVNTNPVTFSFRTFVHKAAESFQETLFIYVRSGNSR